MIHGPVKQPSFIEDGECGSCVCSGTQIQHYCGSRDSNARKISNTFSIEGGGSIRLHVTGPCADFG